MLLSLIVPCYNEQEALPLFYRETTKVLSEMQCDYELLLVNDGSRDNTLSIMKDLAAKDPHVLYFSFSRNFGKEAAMYAGFSNARGDYVAVMDADLQDPPSLLPEMVKILESGEYDSVATRRIDRDKAHRQGRRAARPQLVCQTLLRADQPDLRRRYRRRGERFPPHDTRHD